MGRLLNGMICDFSKVSMTLMGIDMVYYSCEKSFGRIARECLAHLWIGRSCSKHWPQEVRLVMMMIIIVTRIVIVLFIAIFIIVMIIVIAKRHARSLSTAIKGQFKCPCFVERSCYINCICHALLFPNLVQCLILQFMLACNSFAGCQSSSPPGFFDIFRLRNSHLKPKVGI